MRHESKDRTSYGDREFRQNTQGWVLLISKEKDLCSKYMGKFPVISVSLKDVSGADFEEARGMLCRILGKFLQGIPGKITCLPLRRASRLI